MTNAIAEQGSATINSTSAGPGSRPSVTITSTGNCTSTGYVALAATYPGGSDVMGAINLSFTRASADTIVVYADRQLPAGQSIVFDWTITTHTA